MRYQVKVTREIVYETFVTVTAENADMAADEASTYAEQHANALTWEVSSKRRALFMAGREDVKPAPLTANANAAGIREGKPL